MISKVVAIGPESTGKSLLCEQLAQHYQTIWVREYAREYLLRHGKRYSFTDLLTIARGQLQLEDEGLQEVRKNIILLDTNMQVMKVWCEFVFNACHQWILDRIIERKYDLYLLCNPDIDWVSDELREYPDLESRTNLYHIYRDLLINQSTPWVEIRGEDSERKATAIEAIDHLL
ncbi:MAG TPA: AAA family ATPase [Flavitalea sp.]|nr:AAA family ATPase [Flavitalea sp.]